MQLGKRLDLFADDRAAGGAGDGAYLFAVRGGRSWGLLHGRLSGGAFLADKALRALLGRFAVQAGLAAFRANGMVVAVAAGITAAAPFIGAVLADLAAEIAQRRAGGAFIALPALVGAVAVQARFGAAGAVGVAVAVVAGAAPEAPAFGAVYTDLAAVRADIGAVFAHEAFRALRRGVAVQARFAAVGTGGLSVAVAAGLAAAAPAVVAINADLAAILAQGGAVGAEPAVLALLLVLAVGAAFLAVGAGGFAVAVRAGAARHAEHIVAIRAAVVAAFAHVDPAADAHIAASALRLRAALHAGLPAARAPRPAVAIGA